MENSNNPFSNYGANPDMKNVIDAIRKDLNVFTTLQKRRENDTVNQLW